MAVARDADFRQIDHRAVAAIRVVMFREIQRAVADRLPESGRGDIFRTVAFYSFAASVFA